MGGDGSTVSKLLSRLYLRIRVMLRPPLNELKTLNDAIVQKDIENIFISDRMVSYDII